MKNETANQIAKAVTAFNEGRKIDRRGMDDEAKRWIKTFLTADRYTGTDLEEIPDEVLNVFFKRMVLCHGYNSVWIRKSRLWLTLNIYPMGHRFHTDNDATNQEKFFIRLDTAGYLYFASAGSIWGIRPINH